MKLHTTIAALCFFFTFLASFCNRIKTEANSMPQGYSVAQIIGTWKITASTSDKAYDWDGNGVAEKNIYSTWTECQKDNRYEFSDPYTGIFKATCSDSKSGTWYLDGTLLVWKPSGLSAQSENITALTSNTINTTTAVQLSGQNFVISKVWTRQ